MAEPKVKQGNADAHRQKDKSTDGGDQVTVEATTGGDDGDPPDDPDGGDDGTGQAHGGDDDGSLGGFLTNKKVIIALVVIAAIGLYLASRQTDYYYEDGDSGNVNSAANRADRPTANSPEDIEAAMGEQPVEGNQHIPKDQNDPLAADGYVLENTSIFPSISGRDDRGAT